MNHHLLFTEKHWLTLLVFHKTSTWLTWQDILTAFTCWFIHFLISIIYIIYNILKYNNETTNLSTSISIIILNNSISQLICQWYCGDEFELWLWNKQKLSFLPKILLSMEVSTNNSRQKTKTKNNYSLCHRLVICQ